MKKLKQWTFMTKAIFLGLILIGLSSFANREPEYCKMADRITKKYINEIAKPRGLTLCTKGGAMMDDIKKVVLGFSSLDILSIDEARKMYVEMMEEYLSRINSHEKIRPYLHNFPFENANLELIVRFVNFDGLAIQEGHIAVMSVVQDHLYFATFNPSTGTADFHIVHE